MEERAIWSGRHWRREARGVVEHADGGPVEGAQDAFARYVLPEVEVLLRVARTLTHDPADAEDLVQDTLLRAYRAIGRFDGAHPRAWLLTIMRNAQMNRADRRRPELLDDRHASDRLAADSREAPDEGVAAGTFDAAVGDALSALPDKFRQILTMVDLNGLSYAEAAEALGVPEGTVMSRLHRARSRVRQQLVAAGLAPRRKL